MRKAMTTLVGVLTASCVLAGEAAKVEPKGERKGPLAGLPSVPGPHIEKIKALADNQWLNLGSPAADAKWGKGRGRSWCPHMPYAPELKAAFLYGEGVHSFCKPDGRFMDDLFAYDVNAHRWICLYPGGDMKNIVLKKDANGFETDEDGQPIPLAPMVHAFEQVAFDTDRGKFMFMPCPSGFQIEPWKERRKLWDGGYPANCSPWMYNAATGKFELLKTGGDYPGTNYSDIMVYVPSIKKAVFIRTQLNRANAWAYDSQANTWSKRSPKGPAPPFGIDATACLDLKRERIYFGGGYYPVAPGNSAFWCYDVKTNMWMDLQPKGKTCGGSNRYGPNMAVMNYDSENDVVALFYHGDPASNPDQEKGRGIYIYDPAANAWNETPQALPKEVCIAGQSGLQISGFYNPELNAHFFYAASDSSENGTMWAYRYKKAAK